MQQFALKWFHEQSTLRFLLHEWGPLTVFYMARAPSRIFLHHADTICPALSHCLNLWRNMTKWLEEKEKKPLTGKSLHLQKLSMQLHRVNANKFETCDWMSKSHFLFSQLFRGISTYWKKRQKYMSTATFHVNRDKLQFISWLRHIF